MQSIATQLSQAREALASVAGDLAALEARVLAAHAWNMSPEALVRDANEPRDAGSFAALIERRLAREPIAYITGSRQFWRDEFMVTRSVLTPRADSETMIEALLRHRPNHAAALRVLDLGTGSGCLLLSALREYPTASGVGADQSDAALAVAARNADQLQLTPRSRFVRSNWCSNIDEQFDVVLANPPYIATSDIAELDTDVRAYEPHAALDGGADGLNCYRDIFAQILPYLRPNALLLFEVGAGQAADVKALGQAQGLDWIETTTDLAGIERVVAFTNE